MGEAERVLFDSVQIGAPDLEIGVRAYRLLLGAEPIRLHSGGWRFQLDRGAVEIEEGDEGLRAMQLLRSAALEPDLGFNGLEVRTTRVIGDAAAVGGSPSAPSSPAVRDVRSASDSVHAIDHVVIASVDLDRAIRLWRDRLGVRLALDREFPRRGLRMLFFRSAGVTLEFVSAIGAADAGGSDALNGVAYQVRDLASCRARLAGAGLDVSEMRDGHKQGTRVATVRSGTLGVPTLLIEQPGREHLTGRSGGSGGATGAESAGRPASG